VREYPQFTIDNYGKREMEESKKKEIELKWRRLLKSAKEDTDKPARRGSASSSEVKVIRRRRKRVVNTAA
jgi:hypothetical protein